MAKVVLGSGGVHIIRYTAIACRRMTEAPMTYIDESQHKLDAADLLLVKELG